MVPYIIAFFLTNILVYIGETLYKKNKKSGIPVLIISMLPIILLCGLRTVDLGWDTEKYLVSIYNHLSNSDLSYLISYMNVRGTEKGFVILVYLLIKINNNINFVMTGLNAIVTYSVLYFAIKESKKYNNSILLTIIIYETTLYSITFNTLRQCISLAIMLIMCIKYQEDKKIIYIILILLSLAFHSSAVMMIPFYFLMKINDSKKLSKKHKIIFNLILMTIIILSLLVYEDLLIYLFKVGYIPEKYISYLDSKYNSQVLVIRWPFLFFKTFNVFMGFIYYQNKTISIEEKNENKKWYIMIIIDFMASLLSMKILNIHRITYYIFFPAVFAFVPQFSKIFKNDKKNKLFNFLLISLVYILYFITSLEYYDMLPYKGIF